MILGVFVTFMALAAVLVALGYYTGDTHHALVGFFFFFVLGTILFLGGLQYKIGGAETTTYAYLNGTLDNTTTISTDTYGDYTGDNAHWLGVLLALGAGFGMALTMYNWRQRR